MSHQSPPVGDNFTQPDQQNGEQQHNEAAAGDDAERTYYLASAGLTFRGEPGSSILPPEKGFSIQIGSDVFRLSGASIMSDAPSYFSDFFEHQIQQNEGNDSPIRTLYIDRDPVTFKDIALHLQGYHVQPRDGSHYVRLFADAQFYSLPRLMKQLFESDMVVQIGDQHFSIPRDIFSSPGDYPNFFSLGFAHYFNEPNDLFPGLPRDGLIRPPSITPPLVSGRSAKTFAELLHVLRGYPLHITSEEHRAELLRDCKYYHLRGVEQKLILHQISYNIARQKPEIILRIEDIRRAGISFLADKDPTTGGPPFGGWVNYARPFVDDKSYELIVEIRNEGCRIDIRTMRAEVFGDVRARITSLFQVVADKMNLPMDLPLGLLMSTGGASNRPASPGNTPLSEDRVKVFIGREAHVLVDGQRFYPEGGQMQSSVERGESQSSSFGTPVAQPAAPPLPPAPPPFRKRRRVMDSQDGDHEDDLFEQWIVRSAQWRLRVQPRTRMSMSEPPKEGMEIVMHAVKLDVVSGEGGRNALRGFLA